MQDKLYKYNLTYLKGMALLFGLVFTTVSVVGLLWPGSINLYNGEIKVEPRDDSTYYNILGEFLLVGIAALLAFRWLHLRVRRVIASELGLLVMSNPVKAVTWSEVSSVKKTLKEVLGGFYLVSLSDGTETYAPIEHELPRLFTLGTFGTKPTRLEQLCRKYGVWID